MLIYNMNYSESQSFPSSFPCGDLSSRWSDSGPTPGKLGATARLWPFWEPKSSAGPRWQCSPLGARPPLQEDAHSSEARYLEAPPQGDLPPCRLER